MQDPRQSTPRKRRKSAQRYVQVHYRDANDTTGSKRYRRVIPEEKRHLFPPKEDGTPVREFIRPLEGPKAVRWDEAHAEYERIARGDALHALQPVAPPAWESDAELAYLRGLVESGANVSAVLALKERAATVIRRNIALGLADQSLEAHAAKADRLASIARGETPAPTVTLKEASKRFLATITVKGTLSSYKPKLADIVEALGETRDVRVVTPNDCRAFAETLHNLPSNRRKKFPNHSLAEAMKLDAPTIKPETQRGYVALLKNFLGWCKSTELIASNPATDLSRPKGRRGTRKSYEPDHLEIIFNAAPYRPDERDKEPSLFWIFPIALFTGARRGEIALLRKQDVKHERGVHHFDLREDPEAGRTLKTLSSIRKVPIHPELIKMGILDFVAKLPKGAWLFRDLTHAKDPGDAFGKRWARHLDALGITDKGLTLHSTRHSFQTAGRESQIEKVYRDLIGGWASQDVSETYGSNTLTTLHRELSKLSFEVTLDHLYKSAPERSATA